MPYAVKFVPFVHPLHRPHAGRPVLVPVLVARPGRHMAVRLKRHTRRFGAFPQYLPLLERRQLRSHRQLQSSPRGALRFRQSALAVGRHLGDAGRGARC